MLNPIDADTVIRDGGAIGRFPTQIHQGVAWWLGSCLVVTQKAARIVVAHNGHPTIIEFADRLCRGATNAEHYACTVRYLGHQSEETLLRTLADLQEAPGAWLAADTDDPDAGPRIRITLYNGQGVALDDANGLRDIRQLIAEDRVPRPVNTQARGAIEHWQPEHATGGEAL